MCARATFLDDALQTANRRAALSVLVTNLCRRLESVMCNSVSSRKNKHNETPTVRPCLLLLMHRPRLVMWTANSVGNPLRKLLLNPLESRDPKIVEALAKRKNRGAKSVPRYARAYVRRSFLAMVLHS